VTLVVKTIAERRVEQTVSLKADTEIVRSVRL
jgi:hypothetical protein